MKSEKIEISGNGFRYQVLVGAGLMAEAGELIRERFAGSHCAIIADENCVRLFGARVRDNLVEQGFQPVTIVISPGENSKSLREVEGICDKMIAAGLDRRSFILGLGGGVNFYRPADRTEAQPSQGVGIVYRWHTFHSGWGPTFTVDFHNTRFSGRRRA